MISKILQPWWRLTRSQTLGAQGVVFDADGAVLLIRHGYRPGWYFPGGGVERLETTLTGACREVREETGIEINAQTAKFHGLFANFSAFPGDHIALYVAQDWERMEMPKPNAEIREQGFFQPDNLPEGTSAPTRRRLNEILHAHTITQDW